MSSNFLSSLQLLDSSNEQIDCNFASIFTMSMFYFNAIRLEFECELKRDI